MKEVPKEGQSIFWLLYIPGRIWGIATNRDDVLSIVRLPAGHLEALVVGGSVLCSLWGGMRNEIQLSSAAVCFSIA